MWTYEQALRLVIAYVDVATDGGAIVLESETIDKPYGWVFFYQSREAVESGDPLKGYAGNAPLIFNRVFGEYHVTGTAMPIEHYIQEYERALPPTHLEMKPQLRRR
jgi:hypothetical protein